MVETLRELLKNQFEAALCTLNECIRASPQSAWNNPVANYKFCQVAFHTAFYADYYLGPNAETFRQQPFHRENSALFRDYEEFEDRAPVLLYDKVLVETYVTHCRKKAAEVISAETADSLNAAAEFARRTFSRAELHVYNLRHIQHHAAQLSLRLRLDSQQEIPWIGSGWRDR